MLEYVVYLKYEQSDKWIPAERTFREEEAIEKSRSLSLINSCWAKALYEPKVGSVELICRHFHGINM